MTIIQAIILAIIEGITEFLPVSSTGHMIIGSSIMGIQQDEFVKLFTVAIQFGAILSVIALYWKRFFQTFDFYTTLFVAFLPAVVAGLLLNDFINALLENVVVVGVMLFLGGVVFLFIDRWAPGGKNEETQPISYKKAFIIGVWQCIAMVPGVSRSAATIIGGMTQGLSRKNAAEFSFFLAVPTMFGATVKSIYDYIKDGGEFTSEHFQLFAIGNVVAFIVAIIAIRSFIAFLSRHGFKAFGWYRIVVGGVIIVLYLMNVPLQMM
ncbi:MAG: undecaprenyl-diphosphate phosphatase [Flavobacteriales bacterium]|nr:undecaprenyl-diphosphate phosphatase [Flavobacteriales bacterium]MBK6944089.1 undecaprenyl-diphosphate phosphatase [Flavobacteriales bacterium]MBK7240292.1 undecaprenyl-diphosphate phosphatase [Flavobacteriales bacterium]MBK7295417.1 undecaprenyl-diphosphate phosphatase [Flavobacteriales bacterium]MBK9533757.1 undecaprenyl-diphosphate phosphatase [Flavobacteriales bacterium]